MRSEYLLAVDVGNTNVVLGLFSEDELVSSWRLATTFDRTPDEYGILARQMIGDAVDRVGAAVVSSVVPPLNATIGEMLAKTFGVDPLFIEPGVRTGLSIRTENPLEVGADRIANAVAAHHHHGGPTIVVDFGTATTFDLVTGNGEYRGGLIAPGLAISSEALFARAARLPRVDVRKPAQLIGTSTVASLQSGFYYGYLGLVDGILGRMKGATADVRTVIATGSVVGSIIEESEHIDLYDPALTLKGLKIVYDRNRARKEKRH